MEATPSHPATVLILLTLTGMTVYLLLEPSGTAPGCDPAFIERTQPAASGGTLHTALCGDAAIWMRTSLNSYRNRVETMVRRAGRSIYATLRTQPGPARQPFDPSTGRVILRPDDPGTGHWIGAPATLHDPDTGFVYLYTRSRSPKQRGYRATIWRTRNGDRFEPVWTLEKEDIGALSLERATLHRTATGNYTLFLSYHDANTGNWEVLRVEAAAPRGFDPADGHLLPHPRGALHLKDPVIYGDTLYLHAPSRTFRSTTTFIAELANGTPTFTGELDIGPDTTTARRLTTLLPLNTTTLAFYDWRPTLVHSGAEMSRYGRLEETVVHPILLNTTLRSMEGSGALRYLTAEQVRNETWFFYERATRTGEHALILQTVPTRTLQERIPALS